MATRRDPSIVLMLALGMWARDPKSDLSAPQRDQWRSRLRTAHAFGLPLALSREERLESAVPLLTYVAVHRPGMLATVRQALQEEHNDTPGYGE